MEITRPSKNSALPDACMPSLSISIIFPMYNEEECIGRTVYWAEKALEHITDDFEIIIVNDASTDNSPDIVKNIAICNHRIRLLHHPQNMRLGMTLRTGFENASKDLIFYCDSDLPVNLEELSKAVDIMAFTQADVVTAYRFDRTAEGILRTLYSFVYNHLIRLLFPIRIKDVNFSFKLFKRRVLEAFILESTGSFIDAEMLIKSKRHGFQIVQFGVDYFPRTRGISTLSSLSVIVQLIREMIRFRIALWRGRTYFNKSNCKL